VTRTLSRLLLWIAFGLALVVVGTSSGLRLAANGLGCSPWPRCYGAPETALAVQQSPAVKAARLTHRIAASAFALAALGATLLGWRHWGVSARLAALLVLAVTALLSVVGLYTPSPLPAVTLINVLGGLALLGGTAFVLARQSTVDALARSPRLALSALVLVLALQAAAGAMISVRSAGAACDRGCDVQWLPESLQLWQPLRPGPADELLRGTHAGEALQVLHRLGAIVVTVLAAALGAAMLAGTGGARPRAALAALGLCVVLGLLLDSSSGSLPLAVAHALSAGLLVASLALLMAGVAARRESR
jgi:cytochrome c oxidase assembly protein subunit 15